MLRAASRSWLFRAMLPYARSVVRLDQPLEYLTLFGLISHGVSDAGGLRLQRAEQKGGIFCLHPADTGEAARTPKAPM